jgi:hypothetical protein
LNLYSTELGLPSDQVDDFVDYYSSNGWKVGRNSMKSWKSTLRRWTRNWKKNGPGSGNNGKPNPMTAQVALKHVQEELRRHELWEPVPDREYPDALWAEFRKLQKRETELKHEVMGV